MCTWVERDSVPVHNIFWSLFKETIALSPSTFTTFNNPNSLRRKIALPVILHSATTSASLFRIHLNVCSLDVYEVIHEATKKVWKLLAFLRSTKSFIEMNSEVYEVHRPSESTLSRWYVNSNCLSQKDSQFSGVFCRKQQFVVNSTEWLDRKKWECTGLGQCFLNERFGKS